MPKLFRGMAGSGHQVAVIQRPHRQSHQPFTGEMHSCSTELPGNRRFRIKQQTSIYLPATLQHFWNQRPVIGIRQLFGP